MNEQIQFWSSYYLFGAGMTLVVAPPLGLLMRSLMSASHPIGFRAILLVPVLLIYFFGNRGLVFVQLSPSEIRFRPLFQPWSNRLPFNEIAEVRLHQHSEVEMELTIFERGKLMKVAGTLLRGLEYVLLRGILSSNSSDGGQFVRVEATLHTGEKTRLAVLPAPRLTINKNSYARLLSGLRTNCIVKTKIDSSLITK